VPGRSRSYSAANIPVSATTNSTVVTIQLHIPANPDFASLNLAQAVQIIAYELFLARAVAAGQGEAGTTAEAGAGPVSLEEMERFYEHLEAVLQEIDFLDPANPRHLMRRLRRMYNRLHPDRNEINILRGYTQGSGGLCRDRTQARAELISRGRPHS
jgi:tRNA C32,U32 (ribose-2'-O)-methylase TrmJ